MRALLFVTGLLAAALAGGCKDEHISPSGTPASSASATATATAGASTAAPAGSGSSAAAASTAVIALTPDQERTAQSDLVNDCLACHTDEMLSQQRLTPKQWANVVKKMQGWGSRLPPASVDNVVAYLSARYNPSSPPYEIREIDAAAAADAIAKQPDGPFAKGDAKKGETHYKEACSSCHGADAHGSAQGVNIADRPMLWRAADFAAVIRKGKGRMPAFPNDKDEDIAGILAYLRSLKPS